MAEIFNILTTDEADGTASDVGETLTPLLTLNTPLRVAGRYLLSVAFTPNFPTAQRSFQWSLTGDDPSPLFGHENSDDTNVEPFYYQHTYDVATNGTQTFTFNAMKEPTGETLDFDSIHIMLRRIG